MKKSDSIKELTIALAKARHGFRDIVKNKTASFVTKTGNNFSYSYADLAEIHDATTGALCDNGLTISQDVSEDNKFIETLLLHSSGDWLLAHYPMAPKGPDMQSIGAAFSYSRRMALNGILNISSESDTDGPLQGEIHGKGKGIEKETHKEAVKNFVGGNTMRNPSGNPTTEGLKNYAPTSQRSGTGNSKTDPRA